jgi:REP element-mobilizing transposase RayT
MRRPRIHYPGAAYHAMARGVDGREIFSDDRDRDLFIKALTELKAEAGFSLLAYCLMGNHFHLAIKIGQIPLSNVIQRLLTRYALTFNARHDRSGHLFQARYKAILCVNESYLLRLVEYIHANPVRSGQATDPKSWPWSSARVYAEGHRSELINPVDLPTVLGFEDEAFDPWPAARTPALLRIPRAPETTLELLAESVSTALRVPVAGIRSGRRRPEIVSARRTFVTECLRNGRSLSEIGRWLNCTPAAVHYLAYRS